MSGREADPYQHTEHTSVGKRNSETHVHLCTFLQYVLNVSTGLWWWSQKTSQNTVQIYNDHFFFFFIKNIFTILNVTCSFYELPGTLPQKVVWLLLRGRKEKQQILGHCSDRITPLIYFHLILLRHCVVSLPQMRARRNRRPSPRFVMPTQNTWGLLSRCMFGLNWRCEGSMLPRLAPPGQTGIL